MCPLRLVALMTNLVLRLADSAPVDTLLTVPQRDVLRSRLDPPSTSVSAEGRYVAFVSYARLVPTDTNNRADIYVLDRATGEVTLESLGTDGAPLPGESGHPRLSGDGRYVAFDAALHDPDGTPTMQVLLRDRPARTTIPISRTAHGGIPNGWSREPAISTDGRVVVFTSAATDLVPGPDENGLGLDVYMYTVLSGQIRRISLDSDGRQHSTGSSYAPSVDASGRHVAFVSRADPADRTGAGRGGAKRPMSRPFGHVHVRDLDAGVTTRITESSRGQPANGGSWAPVLSGDGRYVAFASVATNLVPGDRNRGPDVFLHDRSTATTELVSRSARRGAANGTSINPAISHDGRLIAFQSEASDLVCAQRCGAAQEDINLLFDVFVFDRTTGRTRRVSAGPAAGWMEESGGPAMSGRGDVLAFTSRHPSDSRDGANDFDLFIAVRTGGVP